MIIHQNPYFTINLKDDYYSINFSTKQVLVLPILNNSHIIFINSIRPLFNHPILELPAGSVDKGESIEFAALREFNEETGIQIKDTNRLKRMHSLNTIPSRTSQMLNIYKLHISHEEYIDRKDHDKEVAGIISLSFKDVIEKINSGDIYVATTIAVCLSHIMYEKL